MFGCTQAGYRMHDVMGKVSVRVRVSIIISFKFGVTEPGYGAIGWLE